MSPKDQIAKAYKWAIANRPKVGGFPYLAEALRQAGVTRYVYSLPSCQCIYFTDSGSVASVMPALVSELTEVPDFDKDAFIAILRKSQRGDSTFPEFLKDSWEAGVTHYEADLIRRRVSYYGATGESYVEDYAAVDVKM